MIVDKVVTIKINNRHIKYYKEKGYSKIIGNNFSTIKIEDLSKCSHHNIKVRCDECESEHYIRYCNYLKNVEKNNKYICINCKQKTISETILIKYGVKSTLELDSVKEKCKKTILEKYGVVHYSKTDEFKNVIFDKYGVKSTLELDSVKEKSKNTMIEKYGVDHYSKSDNFVNKIHKCCENKYNVDHYSKTDEFKEKIRLSVFNRYVDKDKIKILNYNNNIITSECNKGHIYLIDRYTLKNRIKYKTEICTICNPIGSHTSSGYETQLHNFINDNYNDNILTTKRNIISPLELDIYLPELKIAFEFNGIWWHNELNKENNYHQIKTEMCEQQGIQLIHIYEDDWIYKQEIVKSIILKNLNKTPIEICAEKCEIKEISDNNLVRSFLENNHIKGFVKSKIKIGLYYNYELISLMIFGGSSSKFELLRFCNKLNTNIISGEPLLFNYFLKTYNPSEIITYADRSISQGKIYETLGFNFISKTEPNYYYIIDGIKHNKFNFRKNKLISDGFDPTKTEHEIMLERKFYRIYDSGNLKFIYNKK